MAVKKLLALLPLVGFMFAELVASAQTCGGEIVKFQETFGQGSTKDSLPTGRTNYHYNNSSALSDGDYIVYNSSGGKPEWYAAPDHTGDLLGRMMVTNASFAPGEFYRDTVYGLSSLENYEVYLYVMNVDKPALCSSHPILTKLQLVIESYNEDGTFTQISTFYSDSIATAATPTWVKVSGQVFVPTDVTAVRYRIINNSTGGCGNDLAIDDITFSQCDPLLLADHTIQLRAESQKSGTFLSWTAVDAMSSQKFEIQKSTDNKVWSTVSMIRPEQNVSNYTFYDGETPADVMYYRIVAPNSAHQTIFSNTVIVRTGNSSGSRASVFPNPFQNTPQLVISTQNPTLAKFAIFDLNGKMVRQFSQMLTEGENRLTLAGVFDLKSGMYFISAFDAHGSRIANAKMIKN